jgi:Flp pilus assembly pilin Flp
MVVSMNAQGKLDRAADYVRRRAVRLVRDERGQDLIEYALLTGIVAIGWVLVGSPLATRMATAYQTWNSQAQSLWIPPPPTP